MKKTILMLSIAAFCFSCGGGEKGGDSKSAAGNPDIEKGLDLVGKSNCAGCHKIKETSVGPAFNLIGQKYENTEANINTLAEKVIKGGSGNWGQVPMAGHSEVSKEDAVLMVKYVLSLKDEK
ncbi:c-type cytochrome [Ferruginibacter sp. SUN106]|uniref:c-type cytochrome n=1 Tax=Ferruginibacter sp. SUN106 TaxID=2978348 RepID=UPI003D35E434